MTKNFCDLCGEPAKDFMPELRINFPEEKWTGGKSTPGSIAVTDGTWTPYITGAVMFESHDAHKCTSTHHPDLCIKCMAGLLVKMSENLINSSNQIVEKPACEKAQNE